MSGMFRKPRGQIANQATQAKQVRSKTFPAPTNGWVTVDSLIKSRPASALRIENVFPQRGSCRARGGSQWHTRVPGVPVSMMTYRTSGEEKLFCNTEDAIYDITATIPKDTLYLFDEDGEILLDEDGEEIWAESPAAITTPSALAGGYRSYVNYATSGDSYLVTPNGVDPVLLFDGADWQEVTAVSTPIAITNVDTSLLSTVSVYRNRLFFVEGGTMDIWYLPVTSVGGAAEKLTMAGIFELGGAVLFTASWSMDAGDGLDDKFVVVSTEGEVVIFQGSDPSDDNDWFMVGHYTMTAPLGPRATMRAGGDLLVATVEGAVPVSAAVTKDPAALSLIAASEAIEPDWNLEATNRRAFYWEVLKWDTQNMAIVSLPTASEDQADHYCFVVNIQTGAWTKYTGWNIRCMDLFNDQAYFADPDGRILLAEAGGNDDGVPYNPLIIGNWDDLKEPGRVKTIHQARATMRSRSPINVGLFMCTDYIVSVPAPPEAPPPQAVGGVWDNPATKWDEAKWDGGGGPMKASKTGWVSIGVTGDSHGWGWQMTCSDNVRVEAELIESTYTYETGALVV